MGMTSNTFTQLVSSITDYNRKISTARKTLETIHTFFHEGMKPELQKLSQYVQDLGLAQTLSERTSKSEVAKCHVLVGTAKRQVKEAERVIAKRKARIKSVRLSRMTTLRNGV